MKNEHLNLQIYISRNGERHGPYSIDDINAYLNSGDLMALDLAWFNGINDWVPLHQVPGIVLPQRLPPPPVASKDVENERNGCLELTGCMFPILGLIFWAVYANSQPYKARHIGIYSLFGVSFVLLFWFFIAVMGN